MSEKTMKDLFERFEGEKLEAQITVPAPKKKRVKKPQTPKPEEQKSLFIGYESINLDDQPSQVSVTQSNELVSASYKLSLDAKRLLLLAISKINPIAGTGVKYDENGTPSLIQPKIQIHASEWEAYYGKDSRVYSRLKNAMNDLYNSSAVIFKDDVSGRECRWIDEKYYHDGEGRIEVQLTSRVTAHLTMLIDTFTTYKLLNVGGLRSIHSIRIYELVSQFKSTGFRKILVTDLRKSLGIDDSTYPKFNDFKRRVIEHALEEINEKTDLEVRYSLDKKGRIIHAVNFFLSANPNPPLDFVK